MSVTEDTIQITISAPSSSNTLVLTSPVVKNQIVVSHNDITSDERAKLSGIEAGAEVNVVTTNLGSADQALAGNRVISTDGNDLTFKDGNHVLLQWDDSSDRWEFRKPVVFKNHSATVAGEIRLAEVPYAGLEYVSLKAPNSLSANVELILPSADGTDGQFLKTDGSGNLSFDTASAVVNLEDLSNVNASSSSASLAGSVENILAYDPVSGKWDFFQSPSGQSPVLGLTNVQFVGSNLAPISLSNIGFDGANNVLSINTNVSPTGTNLFVEGPVRFNGAIQVGSGSAVTYALPTADGSANEVLTTDGSGLVTFQPTLQIGTTSTTALAGDTTTISGSQASAITANTAKISYTDAAAVAANTAKTSYTDASAVAANTAKVSYTDAAVDSRIGAASIDALSDVDTTTAAPTTGQALVWDGAQWEPGTVSGGGSSPWTTTGNDLYYNTGNVGIGTTTPSELLDVVGDVEITGDLKLTSGTSSIIIGSNAGSGAAVTYGVVIGKDAVSNVGVNGGSSSVTIGWRAGQFSGATAGSNVFVGPQAGQRNTGSNSTVVGRNAGVNTTGGNNVTIGYGAAQGVNGTSTYGNTVAVGYQALTALTTGTSNTAVGYQAGAALTAAGGNTFLGYQAGYQSSHTSATGNTFIGNGAGGSLTTGAYSGIVAVGSGAGNNPNTRSVHIGQNSGFNNNGFGTVNIGFGAGSYGTSSNSVTIGYQANYASGAANKVGIGYLAQAGANSVAIGYQAGEITGSGNIFIGYQAGDGETGSNKLFIENSASTTPLIYGEFDNDILRVNGTLQIGDPAGTGYALPAATGTTGQILSVNASGDLAFAAAVGEAGIEQDEAGLTAAGAFGAGADITFLGASSTAVNVGRVYYYSGTAWVGYTTATEAPQKALLGIAVGSTAASGFILKGFINPTGGTGLTAGAPVYGFTNASITSTAPTAGYQRIMGHAISTSVIYFNPSADYIELT